MTWCIDPPDYIDAVLPVEAYEVGVITGSSAHRIVSTVVSDGSEEKYTLFVGAYDDGSGDGSVPGSSYALGVSAIKTDWETSSHKGQYHGISIVTRGGYHGADPNQNYNPGDTAAIVTNTFVSSAQSYAAGIEGVSGYCQDGDYVPNPSDPVRQLRFQIGPIRAKDNAGIGYLAIADAGPLGSAFQAQNRLDLPVGPGAWQNFLRYVVNFGQGPWEAFRVNQQGWIVLSNTPTSSSPLKTKTIRVGSDGCLEFVNHSNSAVIARIDDSGNLKLPAAAGVYIGATKVL